MDISHLPEEILEEIVLHLEFKDVLSCCLVCTGWRIALNKNRIWFNLCSKNYEVKLNDLALIESPCIVKPGFVPTIGTSDSLTELCSWRIRLMQEAHLSRNWRYSCYEENVIANATDPYWIECDDDVIVIPSHEKREFSTWSIESTPEYVQTASFSLPYFSDFIKLRGGKLVIVQCTLMQVYTKSKGNNTFDLACRFLFDKSEEESYNIPHQVDVSDWYQNNIGLYPSDLNPDCDHNGHYFVGLVEECNLNRSVFHIWNLHTSHKASEQLIPETNEIVTDVHLSLHSSNVYILMKQMHGRFEHTAIHCFSLDTFKYTDLFLTFDYVVPVVLFGDNYIFNMDENCKNLSIWKNKDNSLLHEIHNEIQIHPTSIQLLLSSVIFAMNSQCNGIVKVFNTSTLNITSKFVADYRVTNTLFIRPDLVLVCGWMQIGLWDISTSTKLHTMSFEDCLWTNVSNTKVIMERDDKLLLLHFW